MIFKLEDIVGNMHCVLRYGTPSTTKCYHQVFYKVVFDYSDAQNVAI